MSEGYIGDPVKKKAREDKYRRMHEYWLKNGRDVVGTARFFAKPTATVRRAIRHCEGDTACGS